MNLFEQFKDKKIYVVSDSDCDGIGGRIIVEYYIKPISNKFEITNTAKRDMSEFDWQKTEDCEIVIFIDITPCDLKMIDKICNEMKKELYIFDHHTTGKETLGELPNYYFDANKCGTKIFFDALMDKKRRSNIIQEFVHLTDIYDRYQTDHEDWEKSKGLNFLVYEYIDWTKPYLPDTEKHKKYVQSNLDKFTKYPNNNYFFTMYEKTLIQNGLRKELKNYEQAKKNLKIRTDNSGNKYGYTECSSKVSLVSYRLLKELKDKIKYLILHATFLEVYKKEYNGKISLRCKEDFDVSTIAKLYEGGGHPQSAATELPLEIFQKLREGKLHLV